MTKHLWETKHQYYCHDEGWYGKSGHSYDSWKFFLEEMGEADLDLNLVFRWDWDKEENTLKVYWLQQRRGLFQAAIIQVTQEDEEGIIAWLKPRFDHLLSLWSPLDV